jgi:IS5 family transposase
MRSCPPGCTARSKGAGDGPTPVDRARPGSQHHLITEGGGIPLAVTVTGGNRHDSTQLIPLVHAVPKIRGTRGRPRQRPRHLCGDRAYDSEGHRRSLRSVGITPRIARKNTEHGSGSGTVRWVVERTFAWPRQFTRLRTRYERRVDVHLGLLQLACVLICHRIPAESF